MGVPGFFAWIIKEYKTRKFITSSIKKRPKTLYLDSNCLFHPQAFKVLKYFPYEKDIEKLENKMIKRIINYIKFIITVTDPIERVYISVDGVAPVAKICQQRKRRYRGVDDSKIKNELMRKHKIPHNENWSNIVITPGTFFMEKLDNEIKKYIANNKLPLKFHYSSYHEAGEGEHKILQDIKTTITDDDSVVIYGLDADLIFLSMSSKKNNIYLLRESVELGINRPELKLFDPVADVTEEMSFVSIDELKEVYNEHMIKLLYENKCKVEDGTNFINDFIFICYLLGNDFLPHFASLDVKKDGMNYILAAYVETYSLSKQHLLTFEDDKIKINTIQLILILKYLGDRESEYFTETLPYHNNRISRRSCMGVDDYSKELWRLENLKDIIIEDPIKLGLGEKSEWKFKYYECHFHTTEHQRELIDKICYNYLEGLVWVAEYYFEKCSSWRWQYKYLHAPFISDIAEYIIINKIDINTIKFKIEKPIKMSDQLLSVIPPKYIELIPTNMRKLMSSIKSPIIDMFPTSVDIDLLGKDMLWQSIPLVPYLDIERIENETKKIKLTKEEENRLQMEDTK
jgi:5'-3' exonuclease